MIKYEGYMKDGEYHQFENADQLLEFIYEMAEEEFDTNRDQLDYEERNWVDAKFEYYSDVMCVSNEEEDDV